MKKLHQLISEKESELQNLEDSLGLGFPIVEQAKMTQISHLRLELEDLRQIEKSIQLNSDQQIVLEWLKEQVSIGNDLQYVLWEFTDNVYEEPAEYSVSEQTKAWLELTEQEQFQVLAAFAEWGNKSNE
ncbi:hypothetical protein [Enterococcus xiangfangensis]|uniref:Uncharacterized protein n=1 Tax=Enterococcus xiangfangensis TaxID=1296537 RepID=A0ABU3F9D4_9ENTE|nr:hypothetical protein [Enterococcus xiangfangensis]MDT2759286.1 hypothetical protein [Enterococcus xiangfangensis]